MGRHRDKGEQRVPVSLERIQSRLSLGGPLEH